MADYSTFRDKPSELELKGLDTIIKSISNRYPFIIGYRFVDDNPNIYVTILSLDLVVDADKLAEFYKVPLSKNFDDYTFLHKGYSFCNPLEYTFYTFEEHPCSEDYFKVKKLFKRYHRYLPEKYKFFTHMKDNDTGEMIDFRGDVDVDVNNVYFVRPNK